MSSWQAAEDAEADSWLYITAQWIVQTRWLIRRGSRSSSSDKERKSAMNANIEDEFHCDDDFDNNNSINNDLDKSSDSNQDTSINNNNLVEEENINNLVQGEGLRYYGGGGKEDRHLHQAPV